MFRCGPALFVSWTVLISAAPVHAQWFSNFRDEVHRGYIRNNAWPEPFIRADREAVMLPFALMTANGWRRQNLISDYHFNEDGTQINLAGETKLRHILTQLPPNRRTVYVQQGLTAGETAHRIELVQRAAGRMVPVGFVADVVETNLPNDGWPADDVDAIAKKYQNSRPEPRLKGSDDGGGGGQAGSGTGK
jgi:hypothetical protein